MYSRALRNRLGVLDRAAVATDFAKNPIAQALAFELDFVTRPFIPQGMSFSRASNATQFDAEGRLVWAPHNICTRANQLGNWGSLGADGDVIQDGATTKDGNVAWSITYNAPSSVTGLALGLQTVVQNSKNAIRVKLRYRSWAWIRVTFYSTNNTNNQIRCWVNLQTGELGAVQAGGTASDASATISLDSDGFYVVILSGSVPWANATDGSLLLTTAQADGNAARQGNGASFEAAEVLFTQYSAASSVWRNDFLTSGFPYYGPRFDYDPATLAAQGLLVEEARTNIARAGSYAPGGLTAVGGTATNTVADPRGFGYPVVSVANGGPGQHYSYGNSTQGVAASTQYTVSGVVISSTNDLVQLSPSSTWSTNVYVNFRCSTGTIVQAGAGVTDSKVIPLGGGYFLVSFTFISSATAADGAACIIGHIENETDARFPTNSLTNTIVAGCFQVEAASTASSRIPTYGTSATRAADVPDLINGLTPYYDPAGTTLFCEVRKMMFPASGTSSSVGIFGSAGSTVNITYGTSTTTQFRCDVLNASTPVAQVNVGLHTAGTIYKFASRIALDNFIAAQNGVLGALDSVGTPPPSISSTSYFGRVGVSSGYINGYIRKFSVYTAALTDAQLQEITA